MDTVGKVLDGEEVVMCNSILSSSKEFMKVFQHFTVSITQPSQRSHADHSVLSEWNRPAVYLQGELFDSLMNIKKSQKMQLNQEEVIRNWLMWTGETTSEKYLLIGTTVLIKLLIDGYIASKTTNQCPIKVSTEIPEIPVIILNDLFLSQLYSIVKTWRSRSQLLTFISLSIVE